MTAVGVGHIGRLAGQSLQERELLFLIKPAMGKSNAERDGSLTSSDLNDKTSAAVCLRFGKKSNANKDQWSKKQ